MGKEEFKDAVGKVGKKPAVAITWEDCKDELEKLVNMNNAQYAEIARKARVQEANLKAKEYIARQPQREGESKEAFIGRVTDFVKGYIDTMPDEFTRQLRTFCHMGTALFNQLAQLNAEIADFKEVYLAIHEDDIKAYAEKHKDEIAEQQKQMRMAQENLERQKRAEERRKQIKKIK